MNILDGIREFVRSFMRIVARFLNTVSRGKISPNFITLTSLLAHFLIALLIAKGHFGKAVVLLIIFGLFDTLDGELARMQKRASAAGMLLDAVTDRMKEVLLYSGIAFYFVERYTKTTEQLFMPERLSLEVLMTITVAAVGGSLLVSYVKAKGETAVAGSGMSANEVNRLFQDGFMRFEVRMFVLVLGLIAGMKGLVIAVVIIAVFSWLTAIYRLFVIHSKLKKSP